MQIVVRLTKAILWMAVIGFIGWWVIDALNIIFRRIFAGY